MLRLLLALMLALTGLASAVVAAPAENGLSVADQRRNVEQLGYAMAMIRKGDPQGAIDQYLDPILARYEAAFANDKRQIYSVRSTAETLMYMMMAAGEKRGAIALDATWGDTLYAKAFAMVDLGKHDEARRIYEKAVAMAPFNARYISELGNLSQQARDWPEALATFERAISATEFSPPELKDVELSRAMRGAGFSLIELDRLDDAEAMFRKCLALNPEDKVAKGELAYIAGLRAKSGKPVPTT